MVYSNWYWTAQMRYNGKSFNAVVLIALFAQLKFITVCCIYVRYTSVCRRFWNVSNHIHRLHNLRMTRFKLVERLKYLSPPAVTNDKLKHSHQPIIAVTITWLWRITKNLPHVEIPWSFSFICARCCLLFRHPHPDVLEKNSLISQTYWSHRNSVLFVSVQNNFKSKMCSTDVSHNNWFQHTIIK
jgi:hypothetical protein